MLVVAHTIAYAKQLRYAVSLLESDLRAQAVFTVAPHAFGDGVVPYLRALGISVIPWRQALGMEFDLALAAGSRGIHEVRAPIIRMPHGAGHIKLLRRTEDPSGTHRRAAAMLNRSYLMREGRVVPAAIALPHSRDLDTLAWSCPEALSRATVVGDPSHDCLLASLPHRAVYRRALGIEEGQRLLVLSSTWGRSAFFSRLDALLPRLLSELPRDRFVIAVLVHPNVAAGHGTYQVRSWLASYLRRGVAVAPPTTDWPSLLVAADWVLGDHGSLTSYATLAGVPILLTSHPEDEVAPDSPAAALARRAPILSPAMPLAEQLDYAAAGFGPDRYREVCALLSSEPGRFPPRMRTLMYRLLGLSEPAYEPVMGPAPLPPPLSHWMAAGAEVPR
ncbi:hypothetical protein [Streptomyces hoynatensis]|uniref:hypothetical protein n=1 Tax=Streptomyces hoynatensis TaxID=1141874 RepID=UPI001F4D56F9|nr:hypothetical protein [Streptomyces hoynatensis]